MASYKILFKRNVEKELRSISQPYLSKIMGKISALAHQPRPSGIQMLKGDNRYFRIRYDDYRIIYDIDDSNQQVTVIKIGHRREVYDK